MSGLGTSAMRRRSLRQKRRCWRRCKPVRSVLLSPSEQGPRASGHTSAVALFGTRLSVAHLGSNPAWLAHAILVTAHQSPRICNDQRHLEPGRNLSRLLVPCRDLRADGAQRKAIEMADHFTNRYSSLKYVRGRLGSRAGRIIASLSRRPK
jgi:hypothetical protein